MDHDFIIIGLAHQGAQTAPVLPRKDRVVQYLFLWTSGEPAHNRDVEAGQECPLRKFSLILILAPTG